MCLRGQLYACRMTAGPLRAPRGLHPRVGQQAGSTCPGWSLTRSAAVGAPSYLHRPRSHYSNAMTLDGRKQDMGYSHRSQVQLPPGTRFDLFRMLSPKSV